MYFSLAGLNSLAPAANLVTIAARFQPQNLYFFLGGGPKAVLFSRTTPKTTFPFRLTVGLV